MIEEPQRAISKRTNIRTLERRLTADFQSAQFDLKTIQWWLNLPGPLAPADTTARKAAFDLASRLRAAADRAEKIGKLI